MIHSLRIINFIVSVQRDCAFLLLWITVADNSFRFVVLPHLPWDSDSDFSCIQSVQVGPIPLVSVEWFGARSLGREDFCLYPFRFVTIFSSLPFCACSDFVDIRCVEVVVLPIPITIEIDSFNI